MKQSTKRNPVRASKYRRALVMTKKTRLMELQEAHDEHQLKLLADGNPAFAKWQRTHDEHVATVTAVHDALSREGIAFTTITRESIGSELATGTYDLVIPVGGDGSVLDVSHYIGTGIDVIGVNSALSTSHGHYCTANVNNFGQILSAANRGTLKPLSLLRLSLTIDGKPTNELVMNEVLIVDEVIGATSDYILTIGDTTEDQSSDGIFFGTPGGSTGWMRSYHGRILPIAHRVVQFLTRGLIVRPGQELHLKRGLVPAADATIRIISKMDHGLVVVDGQHIKYAFPRGSELVISVAAEDLRLFCERTVNRRYKHPA